MGDTSLQKFIQGRAIDLEGTGILYNYKFPFDNFVAIKELISPEHQEAKGFLANCNMVLNQDESTDYNYLQDKFLALGEASNAEIVDTSAMTQDTAVSALGA